MCIIVATKIGFKVTLKFFCVRITKEPSWCSQMFPLEMTLLWHYQTWEHSVYRKYTPHTVQTITISYKLFLKLMWSISRWTKSFVFRTFENYLQNLFALTFDLLLQLYCWKMTPELKDSDWQADRSGQSLSFLCLLRCN